MGNEGDLDKDRQKSRPDNRPPGAGAIFLKKKRQNQEYGNQKCQFEGRYFQTMTLQQFAPSFSFF